MLNFRAGLVKQQLITKWMFQLVRLLCEALPSVYHTFQEQERYKSSSHIVGQSTLLFWVNTEWETSTIFSLLVDTGEQVFLVDTGEQ